MTAYVQFKDIQFSRGERIIFKDVNLNIQTGKITVIMGPSGSGKTTLLRLIGAQLQPDAGQVLVKGQNIHRLSRNALYQCRRKMGMLFQSGALFTHLNVFENIAFPLREHTRLPEVMLRDLVLLKLEAVGLRGAAKLMPSELSGGMARRVALARAVVLDPELIMYDEPFTGQDPITMGVLMELIKRMNKTLGMTSVMVSHDVTEASSLADYIYVIADGRVIGQGTPSQIRADTSPFVQQFMQGLPDGPVPFHYPAHDLMEEIGL
jgi:phospholipid/cholesterol/gamma-HCH transport system ATP-binding protein